MGNGSFSSLHHRLQRTLKIRQLLPVKEKVLVAVSGGQDSLCLACLLQDFQPDWGWDLAIAHCDHGWPGDGGSAEQVQAFAQERGLPIYLAKAPAGLAVTEAAARLWRYQALGQLAEAGGFAYVATAHTGSDRGETLLYNLIRGSGTDGLQALAWQRQLVGGVRLVRPLLDCDRRETGQFCQERQLPVWVDPYNQDDKFARIKIRKHLLPWIEQELNPQVISHLAQTAELLQGEVEYLETQTEQLWLRANCGGGCIDRTVVAAQALALQRRVVRRLLPRGASFSQIEEVVALLTGQTGDRSSTLPGELFAQVRGERLCVHQGTN